ncbi:MAG: bifunctional methylenetetrahydrofolate dehydrogenase/methenyltetrahydrofolate cyclohydrolase FolD [Parachlamydiales bacterium]|nr:bifunctional methylenetetrahydrofolate dehydrogenase/methenyltetrahydrofolate cyclohydrolase FolD [Parachlamydiales bacterium]
MLLDGKKISAEIQAEIHKKVAALGRKPGLSVILVGDNPASKTYVKAKSKACAHVGIFSRTIELPATIAQSDLLKQIEMLNRDPEVNGILVQLPLPQHIDEKIIMASIDPKKDVDGFHPVNVGKMLLGEEGGFLPCTPLGIKVLLERSRIETSGKHVVILGRSNIVGKPLAAILMQKKAGCNATVTVAHSQSERLADLTRSADILVAAIGKPHFITKDLVKRHATVIDVGINRLPDGKLVGDVDFKAVSEVADHITPVPGGIGPMTIAMLLQNTLSAFLKMALFLILLASCQKKNPCTHFNGEAMSMPYQIIVGKSLSNKEQRAVKEVIEQTFAQVHDTFDNWNPDSEISKINHAEKETLIPLSPPLQNLLDLCSEMVTVSGGRFDPTIEPLKANANALDLADAIGWNHLSIHNGILKKDNRSTALDLGGIAKGMCIDWIVERLQSQGIEDLVVEWAGDIRALGHHPDQGDWLVPVNPALTVGKQPMAPIPLRNCAMATSRNIGLIDPLTLSATEKTPFSIVGACVIAPTCALADALATAAILFPTRKEAESWAQEVVEKYPDVRFWILSYR